MTEEATRSQRCLFSPPGRGCWTRRDFHDFPNTLWVCAEQPEPVQKRVDGRR